ncbi:hypothetical protein EBR96_10140 [bacterium]|nr:hypothetical protein [bacterium]
MIRFRKVLNLVYIGLTIFFFGMANLGVGAAVKLAVKPINGRCEHAKCLHSQKTCKCRHLDTILGASGSIITNSDTCHSQKKSPPVLISFDWIIAPSIYYFSSPNIDLRFEQPLIYCPPSTGLAIVNPPPESNGARPTPLHFI